MQDVMTAEQAAEYLQTSVYTVKRHAREGTIPAAKLGREWRFLRSELEAWLSAGGTDKRPKRAPHIPETTPTMWGTAPLREILERLKAGLEEIYGDRLKGVYLYGSRARGDARPDSDVDVLVVLDDYESAYDERERISYLVADLCLESDMLISTMLTREAEWSEKTKPFLRNAEAEGVAVA